MAKTTCNTPNVISSRNGLKAHIDIPSRDRLLSLLRYDPESGKLYWKERSANLFQSNYRSAQSSADSWNTRYAGREAFATRDGYGYLCGSIDDRRYQAHRVIWKMVNGTDPEFIDHIDGDRSNNRIGNIRDVSRSANQRNQKRYSTNTSGETCVFWMAEKSVWVVRVRINGKYRRAGSFAHFEDAVEARRKMAVENGYHPNHGMR